MLCWFKLCTQEEIRTPTPIQAPTPQAGASTNFATWVIDTNIIFNLNHHKPQCVKSSLFCKQKPDL